jgi:hypothetical protein
MPSVSARNNSFEPVPAGDYRLLIEAAKETTSKAGDPMIKTTMGIIGHNKKVFPNLVFSEKCAGILTNLYRALGNQIEEGEAVDFEASDIVGKEVDAKLKVVTYEGNLKNEVAFYYEPKEETTEADKFMGDKPF